jgi:beta-phosphoglucomutase family hydrolase
MNEQNHLGVLWDMDGVLVDTGELHYISWKKTLDEAGIPFDRQVFRKTFGMNNAGILEHLCGDKPDPEFIQKISDQKETIFRESVPGNVSPLPGVIAWLNRLRHVGARMAVASSAPPPNIEILVEELKLRSYFNALVSGADLPGKPDPATFLEAARRIEIEPSGCVVVEDAIAGVQAAINAGMKCIAITNTNSRQALSEADIDCRQSRGAATTNLQPAGWLISPKFYLS